MTGTSDSKTGDWLPSAKERLARLQQAARPKPGPAVGRRVLLLTDGLETWGQLKAAGAEVTPVCWEAAVDDTAWLPIRDLLERGWFDAAIADLHPGTWGSDAEGVRTVERPQGLQKLDPAVKARRRSANQQVTRTVEAARGIRKVGGAWMAVGPAATGVLPWDLPDWLDFEAEVVEQGGVPVAHRNLRGEAAVLGEAGACGHLDGGVREACLARVLQHKRPNPPARLVRVSPWQMTLDGIPPPKRTRPEEVPPGLPGERPPVRSAADDPRRPASVKEVREAENVQYPGGLRNPWRSCRMNFGTRVLGRKARQVIEAFIERHPEQLLGLYDRLGQEGAEGTPDVLLDELRRDLARTLAEFAVAQGWGCRRLPEAALDLVTAFLVDTGPVCDEAAGFRSKFRPGLMELYSLMAGDLETDAWEWLRTGAPLGISGEIPLSGVFPPVPVERRTRAEFEELIARVNAAQFLNYTSFEDEPELSKGEIRRLVDAKFLREFDTLAELEAYVGGPVLLNKLALLVKPKPGGGQKLRLITDLLRSRGNEFLLAPERIVLPRMQDAVEMILYLLAAVESDAAAGVPGATEEEVELGSTDVKDAFFNVPVRPEDRRAQCYKAFGKFYVSDSLVFGAGPSPLVWGRVAAWLARMGQGLFDFAELLLQLYVDDPLWACRGTAEARRRLTVVLLLFWEAVGTPFSWSKGQTGRRLLWIGGQLTVRNGNSTTDPEDPGRGRGVEVEVPEEKAEESAATCAEFLRKQLLGRRELRRFAGRSSFFAGLVPHLRPFLSGLWAALAEPPSSKGPVAPGAMRGGSQFCVWTKQVEHSLRWVLAFLEGVAGAPLRRSVYLAEWLAARGTPRFRPAVDASPWGIGGILLDGAKVVAYFEDAVSEEDQRRLGVVVGDPSSQAILEGLALLVALRLFSPLAGWGQARTRTVLLGVKSDSKAALGAAIKMASPTSALNAVGREIAYDSALGDYYVYVHEHVPGVSNKVPDWLSRVHAPATSDPKGGRPEALSGARALQAPMRGDAWWRTMGPPPAERRPVGGQGVPP